MSERYPQWKVDLFRNRNNHRCTCRNDHLPGVTSEKFDPWCAIHGDSVAQERRGHEGAACEPNAPRLAILGEAPVTPSERRIVLKTTVRGHPFVVFLPFTGSIGLSTPDELIINGHSLSDEELARGYYDETQETS